MREQPPGRAADALDHLVHPEAVFVHMGAAFAKTQELEIIRTGGIEDKTIDFQLHTH